MHHSRFVASLVLFALVSPSVHAQGWEQYRGNGARDGRLPEVAEVETPTIVSSHGVGGSQDLSGLSFYDIDGDGDPELIQAVSGRLTAKTANDQVRWSTRYMGVDRVVGDWDFDGDGEVELLAVRTERPCAAFLVDPQTGAILWGSPTFPGGTRNLSDYAIRPAQLDRDAALELILKPGQHHDTFYAYDFSDGFLTPAEDNELWRSTFEGYSNINPAVVADVLGNGVAEVVFVSGVNLMVLDGTTGEVAVRLEDVFSSHNFGILQAVNLDDDPQLEVVSMAQADHDRAVTVFDLVDEVVEWEVAWSPAAEHPVHFVANSLSDIDDDGDYEIVFSVWDSGDSEVDQEGNEGDHDGIDSPERWALGIIDAESGELIDSADNLLLTAVLDLDGDGVREIIAREVPPEGATGAETLEGPGQLAAIVWDEGIAQDFPFGDGSLFFTEPAVTPDSAAIAAGQDIATLAGGASRHPITIAFDDTSATVSSWELTDSGLVATILETLPAEDVSEFVSFSDGFGSGSESPVSYLGSDGRVHSGRGGSETGAVASGGALVVSPVVADEDVLVVLGNGRTLQPIPLGDNDDFVLDADVGQIGAGHFAIGPGNSVVSAVRDADDTLSVAAWSLTTGARLWIRELAPNFTSVSPILVADMNGASGLEIAVAFTDASREPGEDIRLALIDGEGDVLWNEATLYNTRLLGPLVAIHANEDDVLDIAVAEPSGVAFYDGTNGAMLGNYGMPWSFSQLAVVLGGEPSLLVNSGLAEWGLRQLTPPNAPGWGAPLEFDFEGLHQHLCRFLDSEDSPMIGLPNGLGRLRFVDPTDGSITNSIVLQGGDIAGDEVVHGPTLTSCASVSQTTGGDLIILGAEDGWLYAITADGELAWSLPFGASLGAPIPTSREGELLITVSSSDGGLHTVGEASLSPPIGILDLAVDEDDNPVPGIDIDATSRRDVLAASWSAVDLAVSYEVRPILSTGIPLFEEWLTVDDSLQALFEGLDLAPGVHVRIEVRALDEDGRRSEPGTSNGLFILDVEPDVPDAIADSDVGAPDAGVDDAGVSDVGQSDMGEDLSGDTVGDIALDDGYSGDGGVRRTGGSGTVDTPPSGCCRVVSASGQDRQSYSLWLLGGAALILWRKRRLV